MNWASKPLQASEPQVSIFSSIFSFISSLQSLFNSSGRLQIEQGSSSAASHSCDLWARTCVCAVSSLHRYFTNFPNLSWSDGHASFLVCSSLLSPLLCLSWLELRTQAAPHASVLRLTLQSQGQQFVFPHPKFIIWEGCQASSAKTEASVGVSACYRSDGVQTSPLLTWPRGYC